MSAIVCGKRSFVEELNGAPPSPTTTSQSQPLSKKLRFTCPSSNSRSVWFSPFSIASPLADQLRAVFPHVDNQLFERVLEECNNDLDRAIQHLHELSVGPAEGESGSSAVSVEYIEGKVTSGENVASIEDTLAQNYVPIDGAQWVELFVREMLSATSINDARFRAAGVLERLEKAISANGGVNVAQSLHKENDMLRGQIEVLLRENSILKRAVAIQHERQKECENRNQEVQHLKQLVSQYQEQMSSLEVSNYALKMHLRQAQQSNSISGHFHPDIF